MKRFTFQQDDLQEAILNIIACYKAIIVLDIWFELGEGERFRSAVRNTEVSEALSQLEAKNLVCNGRDERWKLAKKKGHFHVT